MAGPRGWARRILGARRLVRLPVPVFRLGLGWAFRGRLLLLEHTGRRTGLRRRVVLETVDRPDRDHVVVCSGLGTSSQWYRNVLVDPRVRVSVGHLRDVPGHAALLPPERAREHLDRYARAHPRAWREIASTLGVDSPDEAVALPVLEITLDRAGTMGEWTATGSS